MSWLPLFEGKDEPVRSHAVNHSIQGKFAIRDGRWKLVLCPGSGGWSKNDAEASEEGLPLVQLYDLESDPGETCNLEKQDRKRVREMLRRLETIVADGRSTPGECQSNDVEVDIWKLGSMPTVKASVLDDY